MTFNEAIASKLTASEYLKMERTAEFRSEFLTGETFAMDGASRVHNQISANIVRVLGNQLLERTCNVYSSDLKVKIARIERYTYPDIVVSCDAEEFEDEYNDILLNPLVLMEILSESAEAYDRGKKFAHYQFIESFVEYVLISQDACRVEMFKRQKNDARDARKNSTWIYTENHLMDDVIFLESVECELKLSDIYKKVNV